MSRLASASIDERGKITGGAAGNQTGKELRIRSYYVHGKGWRVLRCVYPEARRLIAEAAIRGVANRNIGYDQSARSSLYNDVKSAGFDPAMTTKAVETDCSAFVRVCASYGLLRIGHEKFIPDFYTGNEASTLIATGAFVELTGVEYTTRDDYLLAGDILVTKTKGHTEIVLDDGDKADNGTLVRELGERILKRGMLGEDVRTMQEYLNKLGYNVGPDGPDGDFGKNTESALQAFQNDHGLDDDGEYGPLTHEAMLTAIEALADVPVIGAPDGTGLLVKDGSWNIRTGPGTAYAIAGVAHGGDRLGEIQTDGWKAIRYNGEVRYISEKAIAG